MDSYIASLREKIGNQEIKVPGCRVIVTNDRDEYLLQYRSDYKIWGLPAGSVEADETIAEAARRELKEETGLDAIELVPFGFSSASKLEHIVYPNGHEVHCYSMLFWASNWHGVPRPDLDESLEVDFFCYDELPNLLPNMKLAIDQFLLWKKTGLFQYS